MHDVWHDSGSGDETTKVWKAEVRLAQCRQSDTLKLDRGWHEVRTRTYFTFSTVCDRRWLKSAWTIKAVQVKQQWAKQEQLKLKDISFLNMYTYFFLKEILKLQVRLPCRRYRINTKDTF